MEVVRATRHPYDLQERAIRLVSERRDDHLSDWAAIQSVAGKLGDDRGDAAEVAAK